MGVFCHEDDEQKLLIKIREKLTDPLDNKNQKYLPPISTDLLDSFKKIR